jgi:hypothetical protein
LKAIQEGIADGMTGGSGMFGGMPRVYAIRLTDRELGKKLGRYTLAGFGL